MNPAWSVILFTTLSGTAQGLVVALALLELGPITVGRDFVGNALLIAQVMLFVGLAASFGHLGHPQRAWRAVMMWRTSWLSREVIALPMFMSVTGLWGWALGRGVSSSVLPLAALGLAIVLWYCTAKIYASLYFILEWAHPLTSVTFILTGLSSGHLLTSAVAAWQGEWDVLTVAAPMALAATGTGGLARVAALRRNASLKPMSTLQSATGVQNARLVQRSMGFSAGSFNTREFFHQRSRPFLRRMKFAGLALGFAVPALLLVIAMVSAQPAVFAVAWIVQVPGLLADRWFFFAQVNHPQNLYYQVVS
ncbi:DmsC/YnfH family molybdoenzyme membrane anchor subunit [Variovorax sp. OV329]|uniref:dimethyl sulfoxide reductase anchor subunit family protein n=1 Tax=Variovorax sp. OV329 TaxID=1882825 RepID=UPI0008DF2DB4|nr:DmsC/YnfH family molybdoenzyme membrane anchor subunit [Variovorax sp. OV329]SFN52008.1 DMSO reductase anchor subunit [Variovorax sp. OV329]